jgi:hypothetical protein
MRNLVILLGLSLTLAACTGGEKAAGGNGKKAEVELILQTRKSADISALCMGHSDVGLKSKKVLSARMGTWLVTVMSSNPEMTEEIIKNLKKDMDIVNVQLNHKEVEIRDGRK